LSLCFIVFFIFVIANADLFDKWEEQLAISSTFIQGDDGSSYEINLDNISVDVDDNANGIIQYTVQNWDTLLKIAGVFWTTVSTIQKENNLKNDSLEPGKLLKISSQIDGVVYTVKNKTNVVVFANTYNLNLQDLMTLNYIQDESEILGPDQELFINISKERAYELGLFERPKPEIIPKSTISYRPIINKSTKTISKTIKQGLFVSEDDEWNDSIADTKSTIISKWTYTKKIKNSFAVGYCTWYAAIKSPNIFPYISETTQDRPFGGDAREWCANAKAAGLRVWQKPAVGAIIVYKKLRSSAGHVGKVIQLELDNWKMIIEDMNFLGKFVVTQRREKTNNSKISCYIYGK